MIQVYAYPIDLLVLLFLGDDKQMKNRLLLIFRFILMNQCQRNKEENQSNSQSEDINQSVSESDRYGSSSNAAKKDTLSKKSQMASCSFYEDGEWLIKMIKMNPFKMQNIIDWVQCLLGLVNGRSIKVPQNIASLNFERLKRNQKIYYIFIDEVDPIFSLFKIYDRNGCIVSFGFTENVQKQSYLLTILKKMAKKTFVFILDQTSGKNYLNDRLFECISARIILTVRQASNLAPKKMGRWGFSKIEFNGIAYRYYLCVTKKLSNIPDIKGVIVKGFQLQYQNSQNSYTMLQELNLQVLGTVQTRCFITNLIRLHSEKPTKQKLNNILNLGLNTLGNYIKKWEENSELHFPGPASIKKSQCKYCYRKKSEVICKGCTIIHGQQINLCIGACYHQYHQQNSMFMRKELSEIHKNIPFFDKKCKQIDRAMNKVAENTDLEFVQFLTYLQSKILNSMNKLQEQKAIAIGQEEIDPNDA